MDRDAQITLMTNAEERTRGYLAAWLRDPVVKAALRRAPAAQPSASGSRRQA